MPVDIISFVLLNICVTSIEVLARCRFLYRKPEMSSGFYDYIRALDNPFELRPGRIAP